MHSVHDVIAYIRSVRPDAGPLERQKFAYYAQAWNTVWEGRPLFPERIEAWKHGPVCRDAWTTDNYSLPQAARPLNHNARQVVDAVLAFYGRYTAAQLRHMTHTEGPWMQARGHLPESAPSNEEIEVSVMRRYYSRKSVLGEPTPKRPALRAEPPSIEETRRTARGLARRWRDVLDELAVR